MFLPCAIVPVYNHGHTISRVTAELRAHGLPVMLVDDACDSACANELRRIAAADAHVTLLRHSINLGKGAAVMSALRAAADAGFTHALQVDADGQHALTDVPRFIEAARAHPDELVCGRPVFAADMPRIRFYGRYLSHAMVWLETLSLEIRDSMCGMRLYPLKPTLALINDESLGERMDFDIEVLVRLHWRNVSMCWLWTRVSYPSDGISHYRLVRDNALVVALHARLLVGMVLRLPSLLRRNILKVGDATRVIQ